MYCERCGQPIQENEPVCKFCGAQNNYYKPPTDPRKKKIVLLLVIFLGVVILTIGAILGWNALSKKQDKEDPSSSSVEESSSVPFVQDSSSQISSEPEKESPETSEAKHGADESSAAPEEESSQPEESASSIGEQVTETSDSKAEQESESSAAQESEEKSSTYPAIDMTDIVSTTESSYLKESDLHYPASSTIDGDPATGWSEDVSSYGEGEWIVLSFDGTYIISGLRIATGLQTDSDRYFNNARPRQILLTFSDGSEITADLEDRMGYQNIEFEQPVASNNLKVTISAVYRGSKYEDTLISEIELY